MSLKLAKITNEGFKSSKQIHQCCICKRFGVWEKGWKWYGSLQDQEDGEEIFKTCSDNCRGIRQGYKSKL